MKNIFLKSQIMFKQAILLFVILLGLFSCSKTPLDLTNSEPVFSANFDFDGDSIKIQAGKDDYYMYTTIQEDSVVKFTGTFARTLCSGPDTCPNTLSFVFRNFQAGNTLPSDGFRLGTYSFTGQSTFDTLYSATFSVINPLQNVVYDWQVGGNIYEGQSFNTEVLDDSARTVVLNSFEFGTEITGKLTRKIRPGTDLQCPNISIEATRDSFMTSIRVNNLSQGNFTYQWDNGVTTAAQQQDSLLENQYSVTVSDNTGCTTVAELNNLALTNWTGRKNSPIFSYTEQAILIPTIADTPQYGTVAIIWTDDFGKKWQSDLAPQTPEAFFTVDNVVDYELNELGQKTKQLSVKYYCLVSDGVQQKWVSGSAVIAVAVQ